MSRTIEPIKPRIIKTTAQLVAEANKAIFSGKFANMSKADSAKIKAIILDGIIRQQSMTTIRHRIELILGEESEWQAEGITRTEVQAVKNVMRAAQFQIGDPNELNRYNWIGPNDRRTTEWCKNIEERAKNGVSLDKLKQIIKEESAPGFYDPNRPFTPHWSCRHTLVRDFIYPKR